MTASATDPAASFAAARPALMRVAYRMLGSVADAEDVLQDAYLRWAEADRASVQVPEAFLRRIVTRLCLDHLKSARVQRETYAGPWLPEPMVEPMEEQDDVTLPLMLALERLSPLERAAFLLHDVFGQSFDEIAAAVGRDSAACRQLAARARAHVRAERPRYPVDRARGQEIAAAFLTASRAGDTVALSNLLAADVTFYSDGGGKRPAVARVMRGLSEVVRSLAAISRLLTGKSTQVVRYGLVNGLPGFVTREHDGLLQTTALLIEDDRIAAIYVMRNPDKLAHLEREMQ
ncbi:MAG TPA: sigma-70 family RNA polymerase sigma factor [Sphingomonas sp.]|nr:sigma-70 family RNA polymerase sigma factor [Sphingomonas sp.]